VADGFQLAYERDGKSIACHFDRSRVVVGRSVVCDLVIDDEAIARKHVEIVRGPSGYSVTDLHTRSGTVVNDVAITTKDLKDGDCIVLAPNSATPARLVFSLLGEPSPLSSVILSDDVIPTSVLASIDLRSFSQTLSDKPGDWPRHLHAKTADSARAAAAIAAAGRQRFQLSALGLFKSAGEALLASDNLAAMLQTVIDMIVEHLPGRRGVICIVDEASGTIEPRYYGAARSGHQAFAAEPPAAPFVVSRSILSEAIRVRQAMLISSPQDDPRFDGANSVRDLGIRGAMCVPLYYNDTLRNEGKVQGIIYVDSQQGGLSSDAQELEMLTVLALMVAGGIRQLTLRADVLRERTLRSRLERYNSPRVVEQILRHDRRLEEEMLAEEAEVSVLFADLCGFTALADDWPPAEVVRVLNEIFEQFTAVVFSHDGTLDKYIGDAVMAVFGAPLQQADHAARAVRTAIDMQRQLQAYNAQHARRPPLAMRIGINSGRVIACDIGSPVHKAYTVIGDVVNVASRLERSVAQPGEIVVGPVTYEQVKNEFHWKALEAVQLRGKRGLIEPWRLRGEGLGIRD
jgi:adenylate cyclase